MSTERGPGVRTVVSLLTAGGEWVEGPAKALRDAGFDLRTCGLAHDLLPALREAPDAVLVLGDAPEGMSQLVALRAVAEAEGRVPPMLLLVGPGDATTLSELARSWGVAALSYDAEPAALVRAVRLLAAQGSAAAQAEARARAVEEDLRALVRRQDLLRRAVGTLQHDVRTLLNVIVGNGANLRDDVLAGSRDEQTRSAAAVVDAAISAAGVLDRFQQATHDALDASELGALGSRQGRRSRVDLARLLAGVVGLFRDEARQRGVGLSVVEGEAVPVWCERDPIAQVLLNLVTNALKFTPPGGAVTCEARLVADGAGASKGRAELVVSDTGPGVPASERERVFERGQRLERDRAAPGQGLGLAICRELVEQHRGSIALEEPTGGGTLVRVGLPVDPRSRAPSGVLLVRESRAVDSLMDALVEAEPGSVAPIAPAQRERFLRAAAACQAVVLLPRDDQGGGALDAILKRGRVVAVAPEALDAATRGER